MTPAPSRPSPAARLRLWVADNPDVAFAIALSVAVYGFFAATIGPFTTGDTLFAIMERFAVLGLVGLALTLCIIGGEIDLSIGSSAALSAVIVVRLNDSLGTFPALLIAVAISAAIGAIQGYLIAYLRVRAIVLTVGTLMLLRGVALFAAQEKTVMLTDFDVPDFIQSKILLYFSPASLLVIAVFILVGSFMTFTKYGREIYAVGGARTEAVAAGINLRRPMTIMFTVSGFCAGLGGAIIGLRSGTAQALGLQYLLLAGTVAAFVGGVSVHGGKGGVIGAAIGTLTVNFMNTGLVFRVAPAYVVQLDLGVLLTLVVLFQTMTTMFERSQKRKTLLAAADERRAALSQGQAPGVLAAPTRQASGMR